MAHCKRHPVPQGKDAGDFVERFKGDLRLWVQAGLPPVFSRAKQTPASISSPAAIQKAKYSTAPLLPGSILEMNSILQANRRMEIQVGAHGGILGCRGPLGETGRVAQLCQKAVVQKWLVEVGESVVTCRNFMKPMEALKR